MTDLFKFAKKMFSVSVVAMTIIWSMGLAALVPAGAVHAANVSPSDVEAGDLVKLSNQAAVYYINEDLERQYFTFDWVYKSYYPDYSGIKTLAAGTDLDEYFPPATMAAVPPRPGSVLMKTVASPRVYAMGAENTRHHLADEAAAKALYGNNWASKVKDVPDFIISLWALGDALDGSELADGMIVKEAASASLAAVTYYLVDGGMLKAIDGTLPAYLVSQAVEVSSELFDSAEMSDETVTVSYAGMLGLGNGEMGDGGETPVVSGNLSASLAANTPAGGDVPQNTSVDFLKLRLTAGDNDVKVNGIKLSAYGLGDSSQIVGVTVYNDGDRYGNSRDVDSNKVAVINFTTPLIIKAGTTENLDVKAKVTGVGKYALGVASSNDIMTTASVGGSYPLVGNTMAGVAVTVGKLTFDDEGSLSAVRLGDEAATVAKFKVTNDNVEDVKLESLIMKRHSDSTANDSVVENLKLYVDGSVVASASSLDNRYVTFTLVNPVTIAKNNVKRFTVKADVVDGAGKTLKLAFDSASDIVAVGSHYNYQSLIDVTTNFVAQSVSVGAGTVSLEKVNAANTKLTKDNTDVEFGTFKVTVNSGANAELSTLKLSILTSNDNQGNAAAFTKIENLEVLLKNTNTVYDLSYASGRATKVYSNTNLGLVLNSGTVYEFVVRADVVASATTEDYTVSIVDAAGGDLVLKETGNETTIDDITPNAVSLNKVQVEGASLSFSKGALSAAYSAVVGSSDHELMLLNVKAGQASDVELNQLTFLSNGALTKATVSEFKLYKGADLVKTVSANELSGNAITFTDLNESITAGQTKNYSLLTTLVNDVAQDSKTMKFRLSGYAAEEPTKGTAVYDTTADDGTGDGDAGDGVIHADEAGAISLLSARTLTVVGYGSLNVSVDNTVNATKNDTWQLAGTNDVAVATFKFKANFESVKVTKFEVETSADFSANILRACLNDGTTDVSCTTEIGTDAVKTVFEDDFVVTGEKFYTLRVDLTKIGQNEPGVLEKAGTFKIASVTAEGDASGYALTDGDDDSTLASGEIGYEGDSVDGKTSASKSMGVVATKVSAVALTNSAAGASLSTKLNSGIATNAAIVELVVPNSTNTNADGSAPKLNLTQVKFAMEKSSKITDYTATIERVGGSLAAIVATATGTAPTFNVSGVDYQLNPGETVYLLVKVTPTFTAAIAGDSSIKLNLNTTEIKWKDLTAAAEKTGLRFSTTALTGYTISN